jgi:tRNA(fMet)-specific endonuclease VapC
VAIREILLDTNAYAAFKRDLADAVEIIRHAPLIGINSIVLGELLGGFAVGSREAANRQELKSFLSSSRVRLYAVDDNTAAHYAAVYLNPAKKAGQYQQTIFGLLPPRCNTISRYSPMISISKQ